IDRGTANNWARWIIQYSNEVGIDPRLEIALIVAESDFKPQETSRPGAMGLCQLMPDEVQRFGLTNAYDPAQNIWASTRLLREGIDKYKALGFDEWKSICLALAGYNAGHGAVKKYGYSIPPYKETQGYVSKITALYKKFIGSE
ncbi:MAG: lytic transglycosylase domain-containing protein, partial [bacterium]